MHRFFQDASVVENYTEFSPSYPPEVCDVVIGFLQEKADNGQASKFDLMVDVGCGSGQATNQFAPYFDKVIGFDISENQLLSAQKRNQFENVTYKVGQAENLEQISDESVDLLLSATAAHWFDRARFLAEMTRVLKPGGCVALFSYWIAEFVPTSFNGDREVLLQQNKKVIFDTFEAELKQGGSAYHSMASKYQDIYEAIPFEDKTRNDELCIRDKWTMDYLAGYMRSLETVASYMEAKYAEVKNRKGEVTTDDIKTYDIVPLVLNKFANLWGYKSKDDPNIMLDVKFDVFVVLARKS